MDMKNNYLEGSVKLLSGILINPPNVGFGIISSIVKLVVDHTR